MSLECIEERAGLLAMTSGVASLELMLRNAENAVEGGSSSLSAWRLAVLRRALEISRECEAEPVLRASFGFARGAIWTDVVAVGRSAEGDIVWKGFVAIYMGRDGWSCRRGKEGSISDVVAWTKEEAYRLRLALAVRLMVERHDGAERGVRTFPSSKIRQSNWGVSGVL